MRLFSLLHFPFSFLPSPFSRLVMRGTFDGIAPVYDILAGLVFGGRLRQAQHVWLHRIPADASVLIVGGGTGWLLETLLRECQPGRVLYLEASARMLNRATRRMIRPGLLGSVDFRVGDEQSLKPDEQFDVIITPFVLDLFTESTLQGKLIPRLLRALRPAGLWLATDFVQTSVWWQQALLWTMIRFFRLIAGMETRRLSDWQECLARAGLTCRARQRAVGGMVAADLWKRGQATD